MQEVLQADWQEARQFPQPPFSAVSLSDFPVTVLMWLVELFIFSTISFLHRRAVKQRFPTIIEDFVSTLVYYIIYFLKSQQVIFMKAL